jgi:quinohemoprotein ethanol dehydrogenase
MPEPEPRAFPAPIVPADFTVDPALAEKGQELYVGHCVICHGSGGVSGGASPDLRASPIVVDPAAMKSVVAGGAKVAMGMPRFAELEDADLEALRHYPAPAASATR